MNRTTIFLTLIALLFSLPAFSQNQAEMADTMRAEGKIYVVVAIILIVLTGIFLYLFLLDKKIKRLENQLQEKLPKTK